MAPSANRNAIDRYEMRAWRQEKKIKKNDRYKMLAWCQKILIEASIYYRKLNKSNRGYSTSLNGLHTNYKSKRTKSSYNMTKIVTQL